MAREKVELTWKDLDDFAQELAEIGGTEAALDPVRWAEYLAVVCCLIGDGVAEIVTTPGGDFGVAFYGGICCWKVKEYVRMVAGITCGYSPC